VIYLRGSVEDYQLGKEVDITQLEEQDYDVLHPLIEEFASYFEFDPEAILDDEFMKLYPRWLRPYGTLYAY
jgi:glutamate synthase domain-containing protein 3